MVLLALVVFPLMVAMHTPFVMIMFKAMYGVIGGVWSVLVLLRAMVKSDSRPYGTWRDSFQMVCGITFIAAPWMAEDYVATMGAD